MFGRDSNKLALQSKGVNMTARPWAPDICGFVFGGYKGTVAGACLRFSVGTWVELQ